MPLELTDAEVLKLQRILQNSTIHTRSLQSRNQWHNDWLQLMTKIEVYLNSQHYNPTNEPPLVEPHFDENGHPVWPS